MGVSAIIFAIATAFFAIRGYFNGFWGSLARIVSLIGAYAATFFYSKDVAEQVKLYTSINGIVVYLAASVALFFAVVMIIRLLFWLLAKLGSSSSNATPRTLSRLGGAAIGAATGALIGLLLVYLFDVYQSAQDLKQDAHQPQQTATSIESAARTLVSKSAGGLLSLSGKSDSAAKLTEALIAAPTESLDRLTRVSHNPDLQQLIDDPNAQQLMQAGDIDGLVQIPAFNRLMQDDDLRQLMQSAGMDLDNRSDARATATTFANGWQQYQDKKDHPRVRAILQDPEFKRQLEADNKLPLLLNPKLNELTEIIFSQDGNNNQGEYRIKDASDPEALDESNKTIYRHRDDNGNHSYSDRPQPH